MAESSTTAEYISDLKSFGQEVFVTSSGEAWVRHERYALQRIPTTLLTEPDDVDIRFLFENSRSLLLSYSVAASEESGANAKLYTIADTQYHSRHLSKSTRKNLKYAENRLAFCEIPITKLESIGFEAFRDTRQRAGLNDGTIASFRRQISSYKAIRGYRIFGAFIDDKLAAFCKALVVNSVAEIAIYSASDYLKTCCNEFIVYQSCSTLLTNPSVNLISFGLSSVQSSQSDGGLDRFKTRMGFQSTPIIRRFRLNPKFWWLNSRIVRGTVSSFAAIFSKNRGLQKAAGVLRLITIGATYDHETR